jgi:hypothetical protein
MSCECHSDHCQPKENGVTSAEDTFLPVIELAGPSSWPPRSPDVTPCDFYLRVYLKDQVYQPPDATVSSRANFTAIADVDESQSRRTW